MSDLISRQAAIGLLQKWSGGYAYLETKTESAIKEFEALPSAQPEIIRCKDCKHKYLKNMVWTCPFGLPAGENFFCGHAERRTDDYYNLL